MSKPFRKEFFNRYFDFDSKSDAAYINIPAVDRKVADSTVHGDTIVVDRNKDGLVIGIEILNIRKLMEK